MANVVLVGTMDTKGAEYGFVRDQLCAASGIVRRDADLRLADLIEGAMAAGSRIP